MLCVTNVNVNVTLTRFYGFCKVAFAGKACLVIYRFDKSCTCTNEANFTTLNDFKSLFFVIFLHSSSWFDAIFNWHSGMICRFFCLHIPIIKKIRFLDLRFDVRVTVLPFYVLSSCGVNSIVKVTFSHFITCHISQ